jgi:hypothetical protein
MNLDTGSTAARTISNQEDDAEFYNWVNSILTLPNSHTDLAKETLYFSCLAFSGIFALVLIVCQFTMVHSWKARAWEVAFKKRVPKQASTKSRKTSDGGKGRGGIAAAGMADVVSHFEWKVKAFVRKSAKTAFTGTKNWKDCKLQMDGSRLKVFKRMGGTVYFDEPIKSVCLLPDKNQPDEVKIICLEVGLKEVDLRIRLDDHGETCAKDVIKAVPSLPPSPPLHSFDHHGHH